MKIIAMTIDAQHTPRAGSVRPEASPVLLTPVPAQVQGTVVPASVAKARVTADAQAPTYVVGFGAATTFMDVVSLRSGEPPV